MHNVFSDNSNALRYYQIETAFVYLLALEENNISEFSTFIKYFKNEWIKKVKPS